MEEDVEKNEEERIVERGGVVKIGEEIETPHEGKLPQALPCTMEDDTVDNEVV
ncbi:hypothetical protein A2U01_0104005, partial [Trifolium medium]|nr:hypothetical protein [Trifolium medium]